jgi:hypothetical protein
MPLISLREFARRNGVSPEAISRAVKAGRLPHVGGRIDPDQAQPVWDQVKDQARAGRKLGFRGRQLGQVDTPNRQVDTQVDSRQSQVDTPDSQVDAQVDTPFRQVDTRPSAKIVAITLQLNGAEYLDLLKQADGVNLSLPALVLVRCGIQTWREEAARGRPVAHPRGRPVRLALERRSITIRVTEPEREQLASEAREAGMLLTQYIRERCGLQVRTTSLPGTDERENEADDAWERLKRLGFDPKGYFED